MLAVDPATAALRK